MARIAVLAAGQIHSNDSARRWAKPKEAHLLVANGHAVIVDKNTIRLTSVVARAYAPCVQGAIYEAAGIECFPRFVQGGLTRTEDRPAPLKPFHGARVPS